VLVVLTSMLVSLTLFGVQTWIPTFLMRVHHLNTQQVGTYIGLFRGPAGILGAIFGGLITSSLGRRDERWLVWLPATFIFLIAASDFLMLFSSSPSGWKSGMALDTFFSAAQVGPVFGLLLAAADTRTSATATAIALLATHLTGLTGGPLIVGALDDLLQPVFGLVAIRYAITVVSCAAIFAGFVCLAAGRPGRESYAAH
jgi:sugar phosphate permease